MNHLYEPERALAYSQSEHALADSYVIMALNDKNKEVNPKAISSAQRNVQL